MSGPRPKPSDDEPTIGWNPKDFQSVKISVVVSNQTSKADPLPPANQVSEWMDQGFELELPPRSCAQGHHLQGILTVQPPEGAPLSLPFTAKVLQARESQECLSASLEFIQFSEETWGRILALFDSRQEEVQRFLSQARGA